MSVADLEKLVARLESVTGRLESLPGKGSGGGGAAPIDDDPEWMDIYNKLHKDKLVAFVAQSKAIGGDVEKQGQLVAEAFEAHKDLLTVAARNNTPKPADLQALLKPLTAKIVAVTEFRDKNRPSKQFDFLSAISEGIPFLGWVTIAPKPGQYIQNMHDSAQFYTNKVLKEFRTSEPGKADWATGFIKLLKEFQAYLADYHTTGLQWNKDKPAATASSFNSIRGAAPPPPPPPGGAPPPPGPPPPPVAGKPEKNNADDKAALFTQLNKGSSVTSGLRKVDQSEMTHKNPALREQKAVAATKASALAPRPYSPPQFKKFTAPGGSAAPAKKPPVFELQNKRWVVENQDGNKDLLVDDCYPEQTVYIYNCVNSVIQVKGKINSITLDNCKKCGVVFEDLIGTCEFVNCTSVKAQALGAVPTISIDKTDGIQVYLGEKSVHAQIISAKSSEMNICITKDDGDLVEYPLAEQFKSSFDGKRFVTTATDINS